MRAVAAAEAAVQAELSEDHRLEIESYRKVALKDTRTACMFAQSDGRSQVIFMAVTAAKAAAGGLAQTDESVVGDVITAAASASRNAVLCKRWPPEMYAQQKRDEEIRNATRDAMVKAAEINEEILAAEHVQASEASRAQALYRVLESTSDLLEFARGELVMLKAKEERRLPRRVRWHAARWTRRLQSRILPYEKSSGHEQSHTTFGGISRSGRESAQIEVSESLASLMQAGVSDDHDDV